MIRRPPRSTPLYSSAASDVYRDRLCSGYDREVVAKELNITLGTLKNHISSILNKMEFESVSKLLVFCISNGYIVPTSH